MTEKWKVMLPITFGEDHPSKTMMFHSKTYLVSFVETFLKMKNLLERFFVAFFIIQFDEFCQK